jgi:hypothetical protein
MKRIVIAIYHYILSHLGKHMGEAMKSISEAAVKRKETELGSQHYILVALAIIGGVADRLSELQAFHSEELFIGQQKRRAPCGNYSMVSRNWPVTSSY